MLTCSKCGGELTSSASEGRIQYYNYYHCRGKCTERISADKAHRSLFNYFEEVAVKPEVTRLYIEVMHGIFEYNESNRGQQLKKHKEELTLAEKKLSSLEEKYLLNEIEKDSYSFMKPKFKEETSAAKSGIEELRETETNQDKYLKSGINLIQNLSSHYQKQI